MASKLCCTAEQEGQPDSPELPNVRPTEATPARLPLLPKSVGSVNSRFTSTRSEDFHELQQIFDNAKGDESTRASPTKVPDRGRHNGPSIYSLHSLHKMKSMRSLIRRKFSRDLLKKSSGDQVQLNSAKEIATQAPDTVVKQQKGGPNSQVKITKDDLRKDLLSDKRPDEGGYDSDAKVLGDIARNIGKKTPNKRPSIHSIDWTPSTARPTQRHGLTNLRDIASYSVLERRSNETSRPARHNSVASTKISKFREEFSPSPPKKRLIPSASIIRFLNPKRNSLRSKSEANMQADSIVPVVDGSLEVPGLAAQRERRQSKSMVSLEAEQQALGKDKKASPMWERAFQNYQDERAAMFLPKNKELAPRTSPFRERSSSVTRPRLSDELSAMRELSTPKRFSAPLLDPPSPCITELSDPPPLLTRRIALSGTDSKDLGSSYEAQVRFSQQTDAADTVGAWGRYPSHTRADRTFSAGHMDQVKTRDFALEAAINFAMGKKNDAEDDEEVDPAARPITPPLLPGQKKRKKKLGNTRMAKSHSMTFGKSFLKNYTKIFRSQSIEFHKHGQGHRSSISTGGTLEYPELEILPHIWRRGIIEEASCESSHDIGETHPTEEDYGPGDRKGKAKMKEEDSSLTLRPLPISSRPTTGNLLAAGLDGTRDTARVWSAYYENCLPNFPRASTELDFGLEDFGVPQRHSLESRRASIHSHTMPSRSTKHSRNASRMSYLSVDERSMVSVRRSTMDLITLYKEQEKTERERVLQMVRTESMKENTAFTGL
ncbi:hypothetical protein N0V90_008176 [Kalmusia sp. IMI 367209]|nr:hypothetical protein N0V90_008176 [Kalmusia sp. IMI 367209]